jgi:DNA polymerase-1
MGDTIDNIPGAKVIGEKGGRELIQKYGSVESALDHADEVPNKRYREALQQQREQVMMSKALAAIATELPVELELAKLKRQEPDALALAALYKELGFSSLLRELGDVTTGGVAPGNLLRPEGAPAAPVIEKTDYAQLASVAEFRAYLEKLPAKAPLAVWLTLDADGREAEGFGTRVVGIEVSAKAGEGRAVWVDPDGDALKALAPVLADAKRAKIVHDPKLFQVLTGDLASGRVANIGHATQLYSYLLRPTTANHDFADVVMRQFTRLPGGSGRRRIICNGWRRYCARKWSSRN